MHAVAVDANVLFVDNRQILTSAGATAGLDLCLHMVRRDYGPAAAAHAARLAVMPLDRDGGQARFIVHQPPASAASLQPLLHWLSQNLHRALDVDEVARQAAMTPRTLSRRFRQHVGTKLLQWLLAARLRRARLLLEITACPWSRSRHGLPPRAGSRTRVGRATAMQKPGRKGG